MSRQDTAARMFMERHSCSQAVFAAFAPELGVQREQAMRLAAGLGGGMRIGSTCGAATGALLVLGLQYCDDECSAESRGELVPRVELFFERFASEVGSTECPGILGCDYRTPEGKTLMDERSLRDTVCLPAVRTAVRLLEEMAEQDRQQRHPAGGGNVG